MLLAACTQTSAAPGPKPPTLVLAGSVHDDVVYVAAPRITTPTVDFSAGIDPSRLPPPPGLKSDALASTQTAGVRAQRQQQAAQAAASNAGAGSNASTSKPPVAGRIAVMYVSLGAHVKKGAPVAKLDDALLVLGVKKAEADAAKARADIDVLTARIADLNDKLDQAYQARDQIYTALAKIAQGEAQLAAAQGKLDAGLSQITGQQSKVNGGISQLQAGVAKLDAGITALEAQIAKVEKLPPNMQPPGLLAKLKAQLAALEAQRSALEGQLAALLTARGKLGAAYAQTQVGQAQLDAGKAQLATGKATAQAGLAKVEQGIQKLNDAIDKLEKARELAIAALPTRDAAVVTAKDRLTQATIVAPVAGRVVQTMRPGEVAMVNAPVVKIRADGPSRIDTYLTISQLPLAEVGTRVWVTVDSAPDERFPATVTHVVPEYSFPPTVLPTTEVHLLRTVPVTVTLDRGHTLPAGTPVDVTFETTGSANS